MVWLRNDSIIWIRSDYFFFPFFFLHEGNMADQIVSAGEMYGASATDSERKGRERSDGCSCQRHCLLSGLRYPTKLDA